MSGVNKQSLKTTFVAERVIRPIFTGGAVAIDNEAHVLATSLGDDVVLTDPSNGNHLARITGDGEAVTSLTLTPNASHLIVCSKSLGMRFFSLGRSLNGDTIEATLIRSLKAHGSPVGVIAVDRTGAMLATGATDGTIKVWNIVGGYITHTFHGPSGLVTALHFFQAQTRPGEAFSSKREGAEPGKRRQVSGEAGGEAEVAFATSFRLASGHQNGKIKIWDLHKRSAISNLDSHVSDVTALDYCPSQHAIVSSSRDKTLIWWDVKSWKIRKIVPCLELIEAAGFVGDGRLTYAAGQTGSMRYWDTDTGRELTVERSNKLENEAVVSVLYRPGLPFILCAQVDHTFVLYQLPTMEDATSPRILRRICGTHDEIIDLQYLLPDRSMMALATNAEEIRLISASEAESTYFGQDLGALRGHQDIVISLDVDWSGHWIATGAKDNTAKLWRVDGSQDSHSCFATFSGHAESLGAVALPRNSPPESSAAHSDPLNNPPPFLLTGSQDQTVKKWEVPRQAQQTPKGGGTRALFTRKAHEKDINAIDTHPSGQLFASASQDKTVKIWSTEEGEVQGILRGHKRGVWSVRFSPMHMPAVQGEDGLVAGKGVILSASGDKSVKLWSLVDYTCIRTFEGHSNTVLKVMWLRAPPDEKQKDKRIQFASAAADGLVKIWDANSGETECSLDNHEDRVWALAVDPVTNTVVSGSSDSTVTFWKDTSAETRAAANEAVLKRVEQEQELENYIQAESYREAITLALQLNHPGRLLSLFTSVVTSSKPEPGSLSGAQGVDKVLASLSDEQLFLLLLRLRDWNTNARSAPVAQRILWTLTQSYPASRFSGLSAGSGRGQKSVGEILHGLRVYTERHYKRMDELADESYLIDYTMREMDVLMPQEADGDVVMSEVGGAVLSNG